MFHTVVFIEGYITKEISSVNLRGGFNFTRPKGGLTLSEKFFFSWQNLSPNFRGLVLAAEIRFFDRVFLLERLYLKSLKNTSFSVF